MRTHLCARFTFALAATALFLSAQAAEPDAPQFKTVRVFDSAVQQLAINNRRMVTGVYFKPNEDETSRLVGFALQDRFLQAIDFANAHNVFITGINDRNEMVGLIDFTDGSEFGFVYSRAELKPIEAAGSTLPPTPHDINNHGDVVGAAQINFRQHGFLRVGDQFTLIDAPDSSNTTNAFGINDQREVVGCYQPGTLLRRTNGFLWRAGAYTIIRVPDMPRTCPFDINNHGQIVGSFTDASGHEHGFLLLKGKFVTIDIPDSFRTRVTSINGRGDIVGIYADSSFLEQGFKSHIREFLNRQ